MFAKLRGSIAKNLPEAKAFVTGRMPAFMYGMRNFRDIPVFCFHSARYLLFEEQLKFLKRNGYRTLTADELLERLNDKGYRNNGKEIALTFDDGMASVWTVAFPLLQKYELKIVSFILPGLIKDGQSVGPTISDVGARERHAVAMRDYTRTPLCNWNEIRVMHESGLVDFQSHGMYHSRISTSPSIIDFVHPAFDAHHYGNIHIPIYSDGTEDGLRRKILGHPIYAFDTRLSGKPRYFDSPGLRKECSDFVKTNGSASFFENRGWRRTLHNLADKYSRSEHKNSRRYETASEAKTAIVSELKESKELIERHLRNKRVKHFCYPWFRASEISARFALECGYESVVVGTTKGFRVRPDVDYPIPITRLQEEYLFALPGQGSKGLFSPLLAKLSTRW